MTYNKLNKKDLEKELLKRKAKGKEILDICREILKKTKALDSDGAHCGGIEIKFSGLHFEYLFVDRVDLDIKYKKNHVYQAINWNCQRYIPGKEWEDKLIELSKKPKIVTEFEKEKIREKAEKERERFENFGL